MAKDVIKHKLLYVFVGLVLGLLLHWVIFPPIKNEEVRPILTFSDHVDYPDGYLESVDEFGPFRVGERSPYGEGANAPLDNKDISKSEFYVFVQRRSLFLCEFEDCSVAEGRIVACMGGWLSGDGELQSATDHGFNDHDLAQGKASLVVLADKESKIIGIYPNHTETDILEILGQYPQYRESFKQCLEVELK